MTKKFQLRQIAEHLNAELRGNPDIEIFSINTISAATEGQLSFLANKKFRSELSKTRATAVILTAEHASEFSGNALVVTDPYVAFAMVAQLLDTTPSLENEISQNAIIDKSVTLGKSVRIAAGAVIESGARVGDNVSIGANCFVGQNSELQDGVNLRANVSIYHSVKLGKSVSVHSGAVIGSDGFGYANDKGTWVKIPQTGRVIVGDNTEIGANTCIDRGAIEDTIIGANVIIDNLVHIAHNVTVGDGSCICGSAAIAGSTNIGKFVVIAGMSAINGHINICDNVQITGNSMITKSITEPGVYSSGIPGAPNKDWRRNTVRLRQIDKLYERVKQLEEVTKPK